ncbi:DUF2975 domain-containing protein [Microbacterium timonense]|uniref:DUF2975 domain-containing protein n=1 Tax=Microbacterium timonense TaxID=2086576 RepID=UPI00135BD25F|nr:DUF2975 domain-containing protein [Microbacterium timonense]
MVLKALIAVLIALLVVCQLAVLPGMAASLAGMYPHLAYLQVPGVVIGVIFTVCAQVVLVCVWRLLTLVRADSIFTPRAFPWVDVSLAAVVIATVLVVTTLALLATAPATSPSVLLLCLLGIVVGAGMSLLLVVLRGLLRKASQLEHDLSEVV